MEKRKDISFIDDKTFKIYLTSFLVCFTFLILILLKLPLLTFLEASFIENIIVSDELRNTSLGFIIGIMTAIVFSFFSDYLPQYFQKKTTLLILNSILASVIDAYNRCRIFGHETSIKHVHKESLNIAFLKREIINIQNGKVTHLKLRYATQTAHSRETDFNQSLSLCATLKPEFSLEWLNITDKIRLLAENYGHQPDIPNEKISFIDKNDDSNPIKNYRDTLILRVIELFEAAIEWLILQE